MTPPTSSKTAVFTIVSNNYLHFARTLLQSVRKIHPEFDLFCVVVDSDLSPAQEFQHEFSVISLDVLDLPMGRQFLFQYTILELNTAVKPWAFEYLLTKPYDNVIYIDPDICLFSRMSSVLELLGNTADIVLTPHLLSPMNDDKSPSELDIRCSGTYNFGFCAVKNTSNTLRFIHWWQGKLTTECIVDIKRGIFVDQSWIDLVPGMFDNVSILRHPGYNVAYWNLAQRNMVKAGDEGWLVNGWNLVFFHFSGFDPLKPEQFSKHQNRFTLSELGSVSELVMQYAQKLLSNGAQSFRSLSYGFATFEDGTAIPDPFRSLYRKNDPLRKLMGADPFLHPEGITTPVPDSEMDGLVLTYGMLAIWQARDDLQAAFNIRTVAGLRSYYSWFLSDGTVYFSEATITRHRSIATEWDQLGSPDAYLEAHHLYSNNVRCRSRLRRIYSLALNREPDNGSISTYARKCTTPFGYLAVWKSVMLSRESRSYPHFGRRIFTSFPWDMFSSASTGYCIAPSPTVEVQQLPPPCAVQRALECWRRRPDLQQTFPKAFSSIEGSQAYAKWISESGVREEGFTADDHQTLLTCRRGVLRAVMLYLQDNNLQNAFRFIFLDKDRIRYFNWLKGEACPRNIITLDEAYWFKAYAERNPHVIAEITLGHGTWFHSTLVGGGTVFDLRHIQDLLNDAKATLSTDLLSRLYADPAGYDLMAQAEQHLYFNPDLAKEFSSVFVTGHNHTEFITRILCLFDTRSNESRPLSQFESTLKTLLPTERLTMNVSELISSRLTEGFSQIETGATGINLAGYFHSTTGMGEYARSMSRSLTAVGIPCKEIPLPTTSLGPWLDLPDLVAGKLITAHEPAFQTNIIVANGDDFPHVRTRLPYAFWNNRRNIGCWIWETEEFPESYSDTYALSEIWTPSEHSAAAIRKVVDIPVKVISLNLDFDELERAVPDRKKFGIPEDKVVFGFIFDCKSVIERKNPGGLIESFRQAFGKSNDSAVLVLKASSPEAAPEEFSRLVASTEDLNVVWLTDTLSREDTLNLMKSLDVYVSLHRCEGFGLTMAEAMALGKPVIASAYSSNLDFMSEKDSFLVRTPVIETDRDFGPYPVGTRWGEPDLIQAAEMMKLLMVPATRDQFGTNAAQAIKERLNPQAVGRSISALL